MTASRKTARCSSKYPEHMFWIADKLKSRYLDFDHYNLKDPLDELVFIICSTKTTEPSYLVSYSALKAAFPTGESLLDASEEDISHTIASGGLSNLKSKAIKALLNIVVERFWFPTLEPLRHMSDIDVEKFLTSLPNIGKKIARCVMMYSLGREVFPVDTHCWRIARRIGWVRKTQNAGNCTPRDMDRLQSKIPPELRFSLHVNFVSLGREICTAKNPKCDMCPISRWCKKVGVYK